MKPIPFLATAALLLTLGASAALAGDVFVITHSGLALQAGDVRDVFVGDKQIEGAVKLVPIDNLSAQKEFLEKVIKVDSAKYSAIWAKKGFRDGLNPPTVKSSDAEVIAAVRSTPGAVGYVSKAPADMKVVHKY